MERLVFFQLNKKNVFISRFKTVFNLLKKLLKQKINMTNKEVTFDRRNYYIGETLNQMRHGYGVYFYKNKFFRYEGDWVKGKKHGRIILCKIYFNYFTN